MRTLEDIRSNLDFVGCDNQTALDLCDEVERLRSRVEKLREAAERFRRAHYCAVSADEMIKARQQMDAILKETEQQQ